MPETEAVDNTAEFSPELATLSGDIRDFLLDRFRLLDKPWTKLSETEQRRLISLADDTGRMLVRRAVAEIAHRGLPHITVTTGKWTIDKGVKLEVGGTADTDTIMKLAEHGKGSAVLVLADARVFFGERDQARAEPDQPEMNLAGDGDVTVEFPGASGSGDGEDAEEDGDGSAIRDMLQDGEAVGERVDPETGEVLAAGAPGGIPTDEALRRFEEAKADAAPKAWERALTRGREAFLARRPGIVPDDLAGKPEQDAWLQGWDDESVKSAATKDAEQAAGGKRRRATKDSTAASEPDPVMPDAPRREPADT